MGFLDSEGISSFATFPPIGASRHFPRWGKQGLLREFFPGKAEFLASPEGARRVKQMRRGEFVAKAGSVLARDLDGAECGEAVRGSSQAAVV